MRLKDNLIKIRKNKEVIRLVENFFSLSTLQVIGYLFPLITLPYLAKVLGVEKFGVIAFASAIVAYFQSIVDYGFNYTAVRDIAKQRDDIQLVSKIFSSIMTTKILLTFVCLLLLVILILLVPLFHQNS